MASGDRERARLRGDDPARRLQVPSTRAGYHHRGLQRALLAEARVMVASGGLVELTLRGVARRCGVSSAAVYRHYADRDGLVTDLACSVHTEVEELLTGSRERSGGPGRPIDAVLTEYIRWVVNNPGLRELLLSETAPGWVDRLAEALGLTFGASSAAAGPDECDVALRVLCAVQGFVELITVGPWRGWSSETQLKAGLTLVGSRV